MLYRQRLYVQKRVRFIAGSLTLASVFVLAIAWWVEHRLGIVPCELCLWERWPWRVLLGISVLAFLFPSQGGRFFLGICLILLCVSVGLSACHVGVEWGWWSSPLPECHAPYLKGRTVAELLASMPQFPSKPCDFPTYLIPGVPISMALMDGLCAGCIGIFILIFWPSNKGNVNLMIGRITS